MGLDEIKVFLPQIIVTLVLVIGLPIIKYASRKLVKKYGRRVRMSMLRIRQIRQIIAIVLNFLFVVTLMIVWGLRPHSILVGLTGMFTLIGVAFFAQWSMLSSVTAGILMFFSAPYHVGNKIRIIDKDTPIDATIEIIGAFYTHLRTEDDELIVIPNSLFLQKMVSIKKEKK